MLVLIAERGSIGGAAAELQVSQPSISRRIAKLERSLGVALLKRTPRGSSLTEAGRVIVDWSAELLHAADEFGRSVQALSQSTKVAVRTAVSMTVAEHYAPRWLAALRQASPETAVSLTLGNSTRVAELVLSQEADIGILESPWVPSGLRRRPIAVDHVAVVVAPGHPWAKRQELSPEEVAATPLLVREVGSGTRETLQRAFEPLEYPLTTGLELASNTALRSAAVAGMGPAVVPRLSVAHELDRGELVSVEIEGIALARPISLVWVNEMPAAARTLVQVADSTTASASRRS